MATLYYNGGSLNSVANFFNDEAGTDPAGRVPTVGDTVYLVTDSMPADSAGDVLTCDTFHGSNPSTFTAFGFFMNATFNCDVDSFNSYWMSGATINGTFTPADLSPQAPTIGTSGAYDMTAAYSFSGWGASIVDILASVVNGRVTNWSSRTLYAATADAVADPSDVREGVSNLGEVGTLEVGAEPDYPAEADVRAGTAYDTGNLTGTLNLPAEADVKVGVQYDGGTKTGSAPTLSVEVSTP